VKLLGASILLLLSIVALRWPVHRYSIATLPGYHNSTLDVDLAPKTLLLDQLTGRSWVLSAGDSWLPINQTNK
jgi:hypothetical protein